ncbi:MAG: hypothetical protein MUP90_18945 [Gammaproteobacteria bacterium]|nr:hypothetical protein [Gammaproteobacteria bacterium]
MGQIPSSDESGLGLTERPWSQRAQDIATVAWPSFLIGAMATMLFFAFIDPMVLQEATFPGWDLSRMTGYALGFFFFWGIASASSALTLFLARSGARRGPN